MLRQLKGRLRLGRGHGSRGQIVILVGLAAIVMFGIIGLAIDVGRLYVARAELSRAVDAAALAGVVDFPSVTTAQDSAQAYFDANEPTAHATIIPDEANNALTVNATKTVKLTFVRVLGINTATVGAHAKAGFGIAFLDAAMMIDATGSMGSGCNGSQNNSGCPIYEAKNAALSFKNTLLGNAPNGRTQIGVGAFRGCYRNLPQTTTAPKPNSSSYCISQSSQITDLTSSSSTLATRIDAISAQGGSGTNVCAGLLKGYEILEGPANHSSEDNSRRYLILLSDGDNTYNSYSYQNSPTSPIAACQPTTSPNQSDGNVSSSCYSAQTRERELDVETYAAAHQLAGDNVEIFVVGFGVCGHNATQVYTASQCQSQIGNTDHDNTADERLLKCIAGSKSGTNDHYYWANTASSLPQIFTQIAQQIAHRLIE